MWDYNSAVNYLLAIPRFSGDTGERGKTGNPNLALLLEDLGNPHLKGRAIHIAGTNGKGSTARFVKCILNAMGYSAGIFTSPHLVRMNERIVIDEEISDEDFVRTFLTVKESVDRAAEKKRPHLSFFEFLFAMAAVYFSETAPDYVIYETGLGGRLDATNLLKPKITAITAIGLDHTKYLGNTIREIAAEKAGIIKKDTPVVYLTGEKDADLVIEEVALRNHAEAINVAKSKYIINEFTEKGIDFSLCNRYYKYENIFLDACLAPYQVENAALAAALCNRLFQDQGPVPKETIQEGLNHFYWPGRMEKIHPNVILDGAHNPNAIIRFTESVKAIGNNAPVILLFAVVEDKDYVPMVSILCEKLNLKEVYITRASSERGVSTDCLAELFQKRLEKEISEGKVFVEACEDLRTAFCRGFDSARKKDEILFCAGSLYLIGSIKEIAPEVIKDDKF